MRVEQMRSTRRAHVALGGWDAPDVAFTLPPDAVLRLPERRR